MDPIDQQPVLLSSVDVSHRFPMPNGKMMTVLDNITMEIRKGEIICLIGPSGCGKSTYLRILAGLIPPTSGQVLARGKKVSGLTPGVAMVFQMFARSLRALEVDDYSHCPPVWRATRPRAALSSSSTRCADLGRSVATVAVSVTVATAQVFR